MKFTCAPPMNPAPGHEILRANGLTASDADAIVYTGIISDVISCCTCFLFFAYILRTHQDKLRSSAHMRLVCCLALSDMLNVVFVAQIDSHRRCDFWAFSWGFFLCTALFNTTISVRWAIGSYSWFQRYRLLFDTVTQLGVWMVGIGIALHYNSEAGGYYYDGVIWQCLPCACKGLNYTQAEYQELRTRGEVMGSCPARYADVNAVLNAGLVSLLVALCCIAARHWQWRRRASRQVTATFMGGPEVHVAERKVSTSDDFQALSMEEQTHIVLRARGRYVAVFFVTWVPFIIFASLQKQGQAPFWLIILARITYGLQGLSSVLVWSTMPPDFLLQKWFARVVKRRGQVARDWINETLRTTNLQPHGAGANALREPLVPLGDRLADEQSSKVEMTRAQHGTDESGGEGEGVGDWGPLHLGSTTIEQHFRALVEGSTSDRAAHDVAAKEYNAWHSSAGKSEEGMKEYGHEDDTEDEKECEGKWTRMSDLPADTYTTAQGVKHALNMVTDATRRHHDSSISAMSSQRRCHCEYVSPDDIEIGVPIAAGSFSRVFAGRLRGRAVAVKERELKDAADLNSATDEVSLAATLEHRHIVRLIAISARAPRTLLSVQELGRCSLDQIIYPERRAKSGLSRVSLSLRRCVLYALHIARGMLYLHRHHVLHRDLKPDNIVIDVKMHIAKITDFSVSELLPQNAKGDRGVAGGVVGTLSFIAPEVLRSAKHDLEHLQTDCAYAVDVYAYALTCWAMFASEKPHKDFAGSVWEFIEQILLFNYRPPIPERWPAALRRLIPRCWADDAAMRPSFETIEKSLCAMLEDTRTCGEDTDERFSSDAIQHSQTFEGSAVI